MSPDWRRAGLVLVGLVVVVPLLAVSPYYLQRRILFPYRWPRWEPAPESGVVLHVEYPGGEVPMVLWRPRLGEPLVAWFHGSGETIDNQVRIRPELDKLSLGMVAIEYPGFGGSRRRAGSCRAAGELLGSYR